MENKKITFEQICDPAFRRAEQIKVKSEALWVAYLELDGLINISKFAQQYFDKSQSWFSQRLHGCTVRNKAVAFKEEEYRQIAESFRDIAKRLIAHADEIDNAKME